MCINMQKPPDSPSGGFWLHSFCTVQYGLFAIFRINLHELYGKYRIE